MKKTSRNITHAESVGPRRLRLSKEAIRVLRIDDLSAVIGGGGCETTSYTTEKQKQGATNDGC
jgi:hypothetical protein